MDKSMMENAKRMIKSKEASFVVVNQGEIVHSALGRGIGVLIDLYEAEPQKLKGAVIADKIVGKAAAMIFVCAGVEAVYGELMSIVAEKYLKQHGIEVDYGICVDAISNREKTGICPMERSVMDTCDSFLGYKILAAKVKDMRKTV